VRALLPGPFVSAGNANGAAFWQGKLKHTTNDGFRCARHAQRREHLCRVGTIGGHSHRLKCLNQPIRHACLALDQFGEAFGQDPLGTRSERTDPLAHEPREHERAPAKSDIGNGALIVAVDA
jgi:hypothetical protein